MTRRTWDAELVLRDSRMRLDVRSSRMTLLSADLPYIGEETLALRHLLEGLALWQGSPLLLACDVDGRAADGCAKGRAAPECLVPPSPLVRAWIGLRGADLSGEWLPGGER